MKASSPPAEAPTPTMGKLLAVCGAAALADLPGLDGLPGFLFDDLRLLLALAITFYGEPLRRLESLSGLWQTL